MNKDLNFIMEVMQHELYTIFKDIRDVSHKLSVWIIVFSVLYIIQMLVLILSVFWLYNRGVFYNDHLAAIVMKEIKNLEKEKES